MKKNIMGRHCMLALLLLFNVRTYTQTTFNKTIDFYNGDDISSSVVEVADGYIIIGEGWGYEIGDYFDTKIKYVKTDFDGNIIWKKFIGDSAIWFYPGYYSIKTNDGNIAFGGTRAKTEDGDADIHLTKIDAETGDIIFHKVYASENFQSGYSVDTFTNGSFLILGSASDDSYASILIKTNPVGDFIWEKGYGTTTESNSVLMDISDNDTTYLINTYAFCDPVGYLIRKIDSAGNITSITTFDDDCPAGGILSEIGGFIGGGINDLPDFPFNTYTYRTSDAGEILWKYFTSWDYDTISENELYASIFDELPNGDLYVAGYYSSDFTGSYRGFVSKININGDPYWERVYTANNDPNDDNQLHDIAITSDGGIILSGGAFSNTPSEDQNFWVLKLDSTGCLLPGCDTIDAIMELPFNDEIVLYPNPVTNDYFAVQSGENFSEDVFISIFNSEGKMMKQEKIVKGKNGNIIHTENIPSGFYTVKIFNQVGMLAMKKMIVE